MALITSAHDDGTLVDRPLEAYDSVARSTQLRRVRSLASALEPLRVLHVNATKSGGGVAELLRSLVALFGDAGLETDWYVMEAEEAFFTVTKTLHNGLQGEDLSLTPEMRSTYATVVEENAAAIDEGYDLIVLHDPQALGMAPHLRRRFPDAQLCWRCHIDLTDPSPTHRRFVHEFVDDIDHAVFSRQVYADEIDGVPSSIIYPAIDPLATKNRPLQAAERTAERDRLEAGGVDLDRPLTAQVSRFDPWKGQLETIEAFERVQSAVPGAQLLFAGGMADDDPEGYEQYRLVRGRSDDNPAIHCLTDCEDRTINALQREATVVVQQSIREGFGLVVAEALWKETPVVGSNVGGIPLQIVDGETGTLVEPGDTTGVAEGITDLLHNERRRERLGSRAREHVRERFLLPRLLEDWLALFDRLHDP